MFIAQGIAKGITWKAFPSNAAFKHLSYRAMVNKSENSQIAIILGLIAPNLYTT